MENLESIYFHWILRLASTYDTWCVVMNIVLLIWLTHLIATKGVKELTISISLAIVHHGIMLFVEVARSQSFYELRFYFTLISYLLNWIVDLFFLVGMYKVIQFLKTVRTTES